jgi:hypothetical protein
VVRKNIIQLRSRRGGPVSPRQWLRPARTLVVAVLAAGTVSVTGLAVPSASAVAATCATGTQPAASTGSTTWLSDANALYWTLPFTVQNDLTITVKGVYPDARYASFTVYSKNSVPFTANGVFSGLTDFEVAPDAGSVNPWQQAGTPGGSFTLTISPSATSGTPNALPIAPTGTAAGARGWLLYRVYQPASAVTVPMPTVTTTRTAKSTTVTSCPAIARTITAPTGTPPAGTTTPTGTTTGVMPKVFNRFARNGAGLAGGLPNPDTGYLSGWILPPSGTNVAVIRAKAPTTPAGAHPALWPAGTQLRYWSMCAYLPILLAPVVQNTLADGSKDIGCHSDADTVTDAAGYYTFVLGTEAQRAAIQAVPGVTFIPFSSQYPHLSHLLVLRNLVSSFAQSTDHVPADHKTASAAAVMGEYYPGEATCPLATLAAGGPTACIATPTP